VSSGTCLSHNRYDVVSQADCERVSIGLELSDPSARVETSLHYAFHPSGCIFNGYDLQLNTLNTTTSCGATVNSNAYDCLCGELGTGMCHLAALFCTALHFQ
jgi:hypothetical protein